MRAIFINILILATSLVPGSLSAGIAQVTHPKTGVPIVWENPTEIRYVLDQGTLGKLSNAQASRLVQLMMNVWAEVPTAEIGFKFTGYLSEDVTAANIDEYMDATNCVTDSSLVADGVTPIIFDTDGSIIRKLAKTSADKIAGLTFLRCFTGSPSDPSSMRQGVIVLNGSFIDGLSDNDGSPDDLMINMFAGMVLHELGHLLGIGHTEANKEIATKISEGTLNESFSKYVPVMYPIGLRHSVAATVLKPDDIAILSTLYPRGDFVSSTGVIRGDVNNGSRAEKNMMVVARRSDDPLCEVISAISGNSCTPRINSYGDVDFRGDVCSNEEEAGQYIIEGLEKGAYSIEVSTDTSRVFGTYEIDAGDDVWGLEIELSGSTKEVKMVEQLASGEIKMPESTRCHDDTEDYDEVIGDGSLTVDASGGGANGDNAFQGAGANGCALMASGPDNVWDGTFLLLVLAGYFSIRVFRLKGLLAVRLR